MKNIFRSATEIKILHASGQPNSKKRAFVTFGTEADAQAAFAKSNGLRVQNHLVDVFFARQQESKKNDVKPKKAAAPTQKKVVPKVADSSDEDSEEVGSSDEGIEEVVEEPPRQKKLVKKVRKSISFV